MAELKRNPVLILRFDGEDLKEFLGSAQFEQEMISIFSQIKSSSPSLRESVMMALEKLTVDHGLPPSSDSWVFDNIVDPALQVLSVDQLEQSASEENFLREFKKLICDIIKRLQEQPVIVAHTERIFDSGGIRRLLSNDFELNKLLDLIWSDLPKEPNVISTRQILQFALDRLAASADLPSHGTVDQVDAIVNEALSLIDQQKEILQQEQFKRAMADVLAGLMLQLEEMDLQSTHFTVQLGRGAKICLANAVISIGDVGVTIQFGSLNFPTIVVATPEVLTRGTFVRGHAGRSQVTEAPTDHVRQPVQQSTVVKEFSRWRTSFLSAN